MRVRVIGTLMFACECLLVVALHLHAAHAFVDRPARPVPSAILPKGHRNEAGGTLGQNPSTVTVNDPWEFRRAMEDPDVARIFVASDLELRSYNGWGGGNKQGDFVVDTIHKLYLRRNITIETEPQRPAPVTIDLGLVQPLGSLVFPDKAVLVTLRRLILTNVLPPQRAALVQDIGQSTFSVIDCIVKLVAAHDQLEDVLWEVYPSEKLHRPGEAENNVTALPPGTCQGGDLTSECHDGGWYVDTWNEDFAYGRYVAGGLIISKSLFTLEMLAYQWPSTSDEIATILTQRSTFMTIKPLQRVVQMECRDFRRQGSELTVTSNFTLHGGSDSYALALDFNNSKDCVKLQHGHQLAIQDLMLIGDAQAGNLTNTLPFFDVSTGAVIRLENDVVAVNRGLHQIYGLENLREEIEGIAAAEGSVRNPNITTTTYAKFWDDVSVWSWDGHGSVTQGILVGDLLMHANAMDTSGHVANDTLGVYRIVHTLFIMEDELPSYYGYGVQSAMPQMPPTPVDQEPTAAGGAWHPVLAGFGALLGMCTLIGGVIKLRDQQKRRCRRRQLLSCCTDEVPFMELHASSGVASSGASSGSTHPSTVSGKEMLRQEHQAVADKMVGALTLGPLIGRGSFGQVYKATWNGAPVAVKIIYHRQSKSSAEADALREAMLSSNLRHPNIVQTFLQSTRDVTDMLDDEKKSSSPNPACDGYVDIRKVVEERTPLVEKTSPGGRPAVRQKETWIVQEYCDMGSLAQAIQFNLLKPDGVVNMTSVLTTCLDICRGVQYLHDRSVIHGDLKCANVLLCSSAQRPGAFTAKVADFGLSRQLEGDVTHISTNTVGTLTHCPPELLKGRKLLPKADVYSFGIMMWEIMAGKSPFEGWTVPQLIRRVVTENWRPSFAPDVLLDYVQLAQQCWDSDPANRPNFDEVQRRLDSLFASVRDWP